MTENPPAHASLREGSFLSQAVCLCPTPQQYPVPWTPAEGLRSSSSPETVEQWFVQTMLLPGLCSWSNPRGLLCWTPGSTATKSTSETNRSQQELPGAEGTGTAAVGMDFPQSALKSDLCQYQLGTANNEISPLHTGLEAAIKNSFRVRSLMSFSHVVYPGTMEVPRKAMLQEESLGLFPVVAGGAREEKMKNTGSAIISRGSHPILTGLALEIGFNRNRLSEAASCCLPAPPHLYKSNTEWAKLLQHLPCFVLFLTLCLPPALRTAPAQPCHFRLISPVHSRFLQYFKYS